VALRATTDPWEVYARDLGLNLLRAREASGMSQERLANAAGVSTFTYRKLEKGESNPGTPANPRLRTLVALAEILGIDLIQLLPPTAPKVAVGR
jgi:transcriptional regulator with XRE-family HTH domain